MAGRSLWVEAWQQLRRNRMALLCLWIVGIYSLLALYGEASYRYYQWCDRTPAYQETNLSEQYQPPSFLLHPFAKARTFSEGWRNLAHHSLGTDGLGRDVLLR